MQGAVQEKLPYFGIRSYDASRRQRPARPNSHQTEMGAVARPENVNHSLYRGLAAIRAERYRALDRHLQTRLIPMRPKKAEQKRMEVAA